MAAFISAFLPRPRWAMCSLLLAVAACAAPSAPQVILTAHCLGVGAAAPITLRIASPGGGTLRIWVWQRGISLAASLIAGGLSTPAVSPVERYSAITLLQDSGQAASYTLRITSRDSADINGE